MKTKITLRETIHNTTKDFLLQGGFLGGQCLRAVGGVNGTVPNVEKGIIEFPTSDVSNAGIGCGFALAGKRFIQVVRYQGFMTFNLSAIANYSAKSKEMWGVPCPVFVRAIANEGSIGPVASSAMHSAAIRYPGIQVWAPMTPGEWLECWQNYLDGDDPVYCSEHRQSYNTTEEQEEVNRNSCITIIGISAGRFSAEKAAKELNVNFGKIHRLKPFHISESLQNMIFNSHTVVIVDSDYTDCGASQYSAFEIQKLPCHIYSSSPRKFIPFGLEDRTAGFSPLCDNVTPSSDKIISYLQGKI